MARPKTSLLRRILVQTDCAFWCIHDHLDVFAYLGLPTLVALLTSALVLVGVWRTWDFPVVVNILIAAGLVPFLGSLYLGMGIVLGGLVVLPRLLLWNPRLGAHLLDARWRPAIVDHLWIFEMMSVAILLTAISMSWWISLTLVYHDIRWTREG